MKKCRAKIFHVVSVILMFAMVVSAIGVRGTSAEAKKKKNIVILYFSATGTTRGAAKRIKKTTKGKLIEIKAAEPYTEDDLDYSEDNSRVSKEHRTAKTPAKSKVRPKISNLKAIKKAVRKADVVYIGYPVWWGTIPNAVRTFLKSEDLTGKTIYPLITHGGSGAGSSVEDIKKVCKANVSDKMLEVFDDDVTAASGAVAEWLKSLWQ